METKVNYTIVGFFVLILGAAAILIPLWLASGLNRQQYITYITYMNESVEGLAVNAPVDYNGVNVGLVKDISINPQNTKQVVILLNIKPGVPITTHTTAVLQTQGLTGVATIGLQGGELTGAQALVAKPGQPYPEIKSAPSLYARLDEALTILTSNMTTLSQQLSNVLGQKNQKLFTETLSNLNALTQNLSKNSMNLDKSIAAVNQLIHNVSQNTQSVPGAVNQLQNVLNNLQAISAEVKQNPSVLVRGSEAAKPGPGE